MKKGYIDSVSPKFNYDADFIGLNYYGRIPCIPFPITEVTNPGVFEKLGRPHDKMWEYCPSGLEDSLVNFSKLKKPIIITENGLCTDDDNQRIQSIKDHLNYMNNAINKGVDVRGFFTGRHLIILSCILEKVTDLALFQLTQSPWKER